MFKIYFLVALRKLAKEKSYVLINILSLAIGIGCSLVLALYLRSELTYDQHFTDHESIYRLSTHFRTADGNDAEFAVTQEGIGPLLVADYPQLGSHVRFRGASQSILSHEGNRQAWEDLYLVDENVFEVFEHDILAGDPETAFDDMNSIAVSESFARSYFGDEDPIGKILESDSFSYRVTLMFADLPENTHLKYNALYPYSILSAFVPDYEDNYIRGLTGVSIYTYLQVNPGFDPGSFDGIIEDFVEKYMVENLARMNSTFRAELTPLADIHFGRSLPGDRPNGNIFYLYGFGAVAIFLLVIACINYMNLATARATKRAKEVGMRKVVGANRKQLIVQFLGESFVFTLIALVIGVIFAFAALAFTPIGTLMGKESLLAGLFTGSTVVGLIVLTLGVTVASGLYPAFYLSSISPKAALSSAKGSWKKGLSIRQLLVLAQMAISIGVISCTLLMSQQMRYISSKPLGFDKENQVWLSLRGADLLEQLDPLKNELLTEPNILDVFDTGQVPGFGNGINMIQMENNDGVVEPEQIEMIGVGLNYIQGLDIEVTRGRAFSEDRDVDESKSWMVNETLVQKMGWDEPIGKLIGQGDFQGQVVGVTSDFHYAPLNNEIGPLLMRPLLINFENTPPQTRPLQSRNLVVKITGENVGETFSRMEEIIREFDSSQVFDPTFLDARLDELYRTDANLMGLTEIFAGICIFLSAMGLFGLASFNTQQRNKEIGVRKILGASSPQIITLLCKNLVVLIAVAAVPATFVSYFTINNWLDRFAYQAEPSLFGAMLPFLIAILAVSSVALITVTVQSLRTVQANPIEALRYE
ncbi:MAG: FtsX-like permease family protein [Pseudomonadales bacterium]|nr:FtsX-like permease family protein [Pseudomonadales bacterium]